MDISDPIIWRGIKSLAVLAAAIIFGLLGYKLYQDGRSKEHVGNPKGSKSARFVYSGTGPGLVFMTFGIILIFLTLTAKYDPTSGSESELESALNPLQDQIREQDRIIRDLRDQLVSQGSTVRGFSRLAQAGSDGLTAEDIVEIVSAEIFAHEERASTVLYQAFEQEEQQITLLNTILEDHETRISNLELSSPQQQADEFGFPAQDSQMPQINQ